MKGLTLVEVMIALVIVLLVFFALMQTALVGIDSNTRNALRDEAVSIAEMKMNEARNILFDTLLPVTTTETVNINFRSTNVPFTVTRTVNDLTTDNKQINITVLWEWKENTVANGNPYTHSITTIRKR